MKKLCPYLFLLLFIPFLNSCAQKEDLVSAANRGDILEAVETGTLTKDQVVSGTTAYSSKDVAMHDVTFYRITYRTVYMGQPIDTRGLLILPNGVDSVHLLMYCHGTYLPIEALELLTKVTPSEYTGEKDDYAEVHNEGLVFASAGYSVFMPDYIGYGKTVGKDHPYAMYREMFESNIDGLLAVKQFLKTNGFFYNNNLFITGWSQGGGACLSAHRLVQEKYSSDFTVVASSSLAGPHNYAHFVDYVCSKRSEHINISLLVSWSIYAMNKFYHIRRPADQIWSYPVYDQRSSLVPPSNIPDEIFKHFFISHIIDGTDKSMRDAMNDNSFHANWKPVGKVFLHHAEDDQVVPYFNSEDAYNGLMAQGGDIKLYTYLEGSHSSEQGNFVVNTIKDFNTLR
jgi:hypothetical protein